MKQYIIRTSLVFIIFILTSCAGSSNSSSKDSEKLTIQTKPTIFDRENNLLNINFLVKNNYDKSIDVTLKNLSIDVAQCDTKQVSITPKEINFTENIKQKYVRALIEFDQECNATSYKVNSLNILKLNNQTNRIEYQSEEINIAPSEKKDENSSLFDDVKIYKFLNTPAPITIDTANQSYNFKLQLIDNMIQGVSGEEVTILTYDISYGEIEELTVITDKNGFANFVFNAPKDLTQIKGETLSLTVIQGDEPFRISTDIALNFNTTSQYYKFNQPADILVQEAGETKNISIDLINSSNIGVPGKTVQLTTISSIFGSISSSNIVTNEAGRATFSYTAPENIDAINGRSATATLSFKDRDNNLSETVTIRIRKTLSPDDYKDDINTTRSKQYFFQNSTSSITIEKGSEEKNISIDLVDKLGIGEVGKTIKITNIPSKYGLITNSSATTNEGGRTHFTYIAPQSINNIRGESVKATIIFIEDTFSVHQDITINFKKNTENNLQENNLQENNLQENNLQENNLQENNLEENNLEEKILPIIIIPKELQEITIESNSQSFEIPIQVSKKNLPYTKGGVYVKLPDKILHGADIGSFKSLYVPVNEKGIANFSYSGPVNLKVLWDKDDQGSIFQFYHIENSKEEHYKSLQTIYNISDNNHTALDYELSLTTEDNLFSMNRELKKKFKLELKDYQGKIIKNSDINITKIQVKTTNNFIAEIYDTQNKKQVNLLTLKNENNASFTIQSNALIGTVPIKASVEYKENNETNRLSITRYIVISE